MLYREIIAVRSQIHTKHRNMLCGQKVEFVNIQPVSTYSDHWAPRGEREHKKDTCQHFGSCSYVDQHRLQTTGPATAESNRIASQMTEPTT